MSDRRRGSSRPAHHQRGRWIVGLLGLVLLYASIWSLRAPLGLIQPTANLRYHVYSSSPAIDAAAYSIFWPAQRVQYAWEWWRYGERRLIHQADRTPASFGKSGP